VTISCLPHLFTLKAAQAELASAGAVVSIDTLRREIDRGRLRPTRIGRKLFIRADHLQQYLERTDHEPCQGRDDQGPSGAIGSAKGPIATPGAEPGSTQLLDRHAAARLARMTFSKPS
jgi:excisionase family DNA binding protein